MIIQYEDLKTVRERHSHEKIVFCSGSFDLLHAGHVLFFEDCKKAGDVLIVGMGDDSILKVKGSDRPILNEYVRIKMIDSLKVVDYCFVHKNTQGAFLNSFIEEIFESLHPDVWVVNTDASEIDFREQIAKKYEVELKVLERTCPPEFDKISTSKIIEKIKSSKEF